MYTILYTILTPSNGIVWYCKTPMEKAKSLVFCKMAFRGIVLYQGFDFLSLRHLQRCESHLWFAFLVFIKQEFLYINY